MVETIRTKVVKSTSKSKSKKITSKVAKKTTANSSIAKKEIVNFSQSSVLLPKIVFDTNVNTQAIFDVIMSERASRRQGTHKTKNRAEVSGTGKKPWAQKGTGRARAGTLRSNIFVGGGVSFGPTTKRNYDLKVNKKVRKLALASALTLKAKDNGIITNEFKLSKPSTKIILSEFTKLKIQNKKILIITENMNIFKSVSNLKKVETKKLASLSIESIVNADVLILSKENIASLERMVMIK